MKKKDYEEIISWVDDMIKKEKYKFIRDSCNLCFEDEEYNEILKILTKKIKLTTKSYLFK